jgi:hypothetical protein
MLAMLWSLAYSVTPPREFDFMVCSLEILLAASLLENKTVPLMLGRDVLIYLLSAAQSKPADEPPRTLPAPGPRAEENEETEDSDDQTLLESRVSQLAFASDSGSKRSELLTSSDEEREF